MIRVTVAIVTFRSKAELPACLETVLASDVPTKVVVIDNDSSDGTYELACEYAAKHKNFVVVQSGGNIGLAAANNLVMPHIEGEFVLILNPDTLLQPDTLRKMIQVMDDNVRVGVVGPKNVYADGTPHTSYHHGWGFGHLILWRVFPYSLVRRLYDAWARYEEGEVHYVSGACLLIRSQLFVSIKGYDPAYFLTAEDTCDLCRRVRQIGYATMYSPRASITHLTGRSGEQVPFLATLEGYKGSIYYFGKFNGKLGAYISYAIVVFGCLIRVTTAVLKVVLRGRRVDKDNLRVQWRILPRVLAYRPKTAHIL